MSKGLIKDNKHHGFGTNSSKVRVGKDLKNHINSLLLNKMDKGGSILERFQNRINGNWNKDEKEYMKNTIKDVPKEVAFGSDKCKLIFDCGETVHATGKLKDFKKDTLKPLEELVYMDGISGVLSDTHTGTIHY